MNDGVGNLTDETDQRMPTLANNSIEIDLADLADVDGDGDLELVAGNSRNQQTRLYLNDGSGVFTDATDGNLPLDAATTTDIDILVLNRDGWLDIICHECRGFRVQSWISG